MFSGEGNIPAKKHAFIFIEFPTINRAG